MYAGIQLPGVITALGQPAMLTKQISSLANFTGWLQADSRYCSVVSGKVASMGGPGAMQVSQSVAGNRGVLVDNAAPGGYSALALSVANSSRYPLSSGAIDTTQPFTIFALIKPDLPGASSGACMGRFTSSTARTLLSSAANATTQMIFYYASTLIGVPVTYGSWNAIWFGWDGANLKVRSNGVSVADVASAADTTVGAFVVGGLSSGGQYFNGQIADMISFSGNMFSPANAAAFAMVNTYVQNVYGLPA